MWFLNSEQFKTWLTGDRRVLFCHGIPGSGKTMLSSIAIEYLRTKINDQGTPIAYAFCNYKSGSEQTPVNLISSLVKQILQWSGHIPEDVRSLYSQHRRGQSSPTLDEVSKLLQSVMIQHREVFVVIDALDEHPEEDGSRQRLIEQLKTLQSAGPVRLMATARDIPKIMQAFDNSIQLEIRANDEDVRKYLTGQMFRMPTCVKKNTELQNTIIESITKSTDGMYVAKP
jgi:Cdc6-like AAA superfamily ATPase